jgi:hypothetical protein
MLLAPSQRMSNLVFSFVVTHSPTPLEPRARACICSHRDALLALILYVLYVCVLTACSTRVHVQLRTRAAYISYVSVEEKRKAQQDRRSA